MKHPNYVDPIDAVTPRMHEIMHFKLFAQQSECRAVQDLDADQTTFTSVDAGGYAPSATRNSWHICGTYIAAWLHVGMQISRQQAFSVHRKQAGELLLQPGQGLNECCCLWMSGFSLITPACHSFFVVAVRVQMCTRLSVPNTAHTPAYISPRPTL